GDDRDLSRTAPVFRRKGRGLDAELLHGIDGKQSVGSSADGRGGGCTAQGLRREKTDSRCEVRAYAVYGEVVRIGALAVDAELTRACIVQGHEDDTGGKADERLEAAAVERQVLHELLVDYGADGG